MASFDFVDAASRGYEFVWRERSYLFRVAIPVIFVKFLCLLASYVMGIQDQYLRQGLVLMPALFVEAIFVAGLMRYFLYREGIFVFGRRVKVPDTDVKVEPYYGALSRKQCVQGAIAMYVLIQVVLGVLNLLTLDYIAHHQPPKEPVTTGQSFHPFLAAFVMFFMITVFVKSFRLFWLYIPIAMGQRMSVYIVRAAGWRAPLAMIGVSIICTLPLLTFFSAIIGLFSEAFGEGSSLDIILSAFLQSVGELIIASVLIVAMTCGVRQLLFGAQKDK